MWSISRSWAACVATPRKALDAFVQGVSLQQYAAMASLRRKGDRWHIRWTQQGRRETVDTFSADAWSKSDIKAYKRELEVLYEKGEYDPWTDDTPHDTGPEPTLSEVLDEYITAQVEAGRRGQQGGWTEATRRGKEAVLRDWAARVGPHTLISDVSHQDARAYVHREDIALATRKGYRTHINAFTSWARSQGHDAPDPVAPLKRDMPDPAYITEDELYAICTAHCDLMEEKAARKHVPRKTAFQRADMTEIFRFAFYTGLRRGELVGLRAQDIDTSDWMLRLGSSQKGKRPTTIPVPPPARTVIRPFLESASNGRVFGYKRGKRLTNAFKDAVRACEQISDPERVDRLRLHSLRHSCAIYWRRQGMSLADIRDLLRHTSVRTTEIYDRMVPDDLAKRFETAASAGRPGT